MKLMPIPMIATGITRVHQKSSEFLLKVELSKLVVVFICFLFLPRHLSGELVSSKTGDRQNVPQFFDEWKLVNVPSVPYAAETDFFFPSSAGRRRFRSA